MDRLAVLERREDERRAEQERKRELKSLQRQDTETLQHLEAIFNSKRSAIEHLLDASYAVDKNDLPHYFDSVSKEILDLQTLFASQNSFLRSYDIKRGKEVVSELSSTLKALEDKLLPKRKFGFKGRKQGDFGVTKIDVLDGNGTKGARAVCARIVGFNGPGFAHRRGEKLLLDREKTEKSDVALEDLEDCEIRVFGTPSTLHLTNLRKCRVLSGPVCTSVFVHDCIDCVLVIACQQLRLHTSQRLDIYLHVTSKAIMEDCKDIRLAEYNLKYDHILDDFKHAELDLSINNWSIPDDFNWLSVAHPSPNWSLIPKHDLIATWI